MISWLSNLFKKREPNVFNMWEHNSWGNTIYFLDVEKLEVGGHFKEVIYKGDLLRCRMMSGKIAEYKFIEIKFMKEPADQFFGKLKYIKHL